MGTLEIAKKAVQHLYISIFFFFKKLARLTWNNKTCKTCKFFERREVFADKPSLYAIGYCNSKKIVSGDEFEFDIKDGLAYGDCEFVSYFVVGEDFGCVHWKKRENNE